MERTLSPQSRISHIRICQSIFRSNLTLFLISSSLERKLKEVEAEVEFLKKRKIENEDSKKFKMDQEMEIENQKLRSKICNLEVLLQHSTMQCSIMEKTFNDLKQTRDRRIENLNREEVRIAYLKSFQVSVYSRRLRH